ncbi:MAG TPA: hypothetical protein VK504_13775 [Vicinamibacterales bacterium]|nr:hypothetical protein [Vicinamibacterales bacterium]
MSADGPIYHKYNVDRVDGAEHNPESKHFGGCFLFVLDLDHDPFAAEAVSAYAEACHRTHPELASHLRGALIDRGLL